MKIECVWEHNGNDSILYSCNIIGAFTRGTTKEEAIGKMPLEIASFTKWMDDSVLLPLISDIEVIQEKASDLSIRDADSDVLFDTEKIALPANEYIMYVMSANTEGEMRRNLKGSAMHSRKAWYIMLL